MKALIVVLMSLTISQVSFARIDDFGSMINATVQEQAKAESEVDQHIQPNREVAATAVILVEGDTDTFTGAKCSGSECLQQRRAEAKRQSN